MLSKACNFWSPTVQMKAHLCCKGCQVWLCTICIDCRPQGHCVFQLNLTQISSNSVPCMIPARDGHREICTRFGNSGHCAHVVASCTIVTDLRAQLKGISSRQATVRISSFSFFRIWSRCSTASWGRVPAPPSLCPLYQDWGQEDTDTGSDLSSWDPVCAWGTHVFLGFQFVLHLRNIFLGL